ncbi:MAG: FtsX-like permease family protein, partial [Mucilaginibacter sp.]|nr:FtsX-like permease family protein [Mucilaginibacter sp.]
MSHLNRLNTYTLHINAYDPAFLGVIFLGIGFAVLLWFTPKINRAANRFFALALLTIVLCIIRILAIDIRLETYIPYWSRLPFQFSLGFGPLIFFYVLKLTRPQYKFRFKDLLHFIPLLLELSAQLLEIKESLRTGAATYSTLTFIRLNP